MNNPQSHLRGPGHDGGSCSRLRRVVEEAGLFGEVRGVGVGAVVPVGPDVSDVWPAGRRRLCRLARVEAGVVAFLEGADGDAGGF